MTRSIEQLEKLAGIELVESSSDLIAIQKQLYSLMKSNNMKAVSALMKDFLQTNPKEFDKAMDFLVSQK